MSDYEKIDKPPTNRTFCDLPGVSKQLARDIQNSIIEGVSYGTYMWRKQAREDEAYFKKYGKRRVRR